MSGFLQRMLEVWNNMTVLRKGILFGVLAIVVLAIGVYVYASSNVNMVPLFTTSNMNRSQAAQIVEQLDSMGLKEKKDYKISEDGLEIYVREDRAPRIRIDLESAGAIPEESQGFSLFDDLSFTATSTQLDVTKMRALKGELETTINSLNEVRFSDVILNLPDESVFEREQKQGSASVVLDLEPGAALTAEQVKAIGRLVQRSIPNTPLENISITDRDLNLLSEGILDADGNSITGSQAVQSNYQQKLQYEKNLEKKIDSMLEGALGPGRALVAITADLNFDAIEQTTTKYGDEKVRSWQGAYDGDQGSMIDLTTGPVDENTQYPVGFNNASRAAIDHADGTINYEIDSDIVNRIGAQGGVNQLFVSVMIDGELEQAELDQLRGTIRTAAGYVETRGDVVNLMSLKFDRTEQIAKQELIDKKAKNAQILSVAGQVAQYLGVAGAIGLLLLTFFTLRRRLNQTQAVLDEEDAAEMEVFLAGQQTMQPITVDEIIEDGSPKLKPQKEDITEKEIKQFASDSPDKVADIIKTWVLKDEG